MVINMEKQFIIKELLSDVRKKEYLEQIRSSDWQAGKFLVKLVENGSFFKLCGEDSKIFVLLDDDKVVSYCTFAHQDEINAPDMFPWIGFVYTFPEYRGKRMMGKVFNYIFELAIKENHKHIFLSTDKVGLYEKYGFEYYKNMLDISGNDSRIYIKKL